MALIKRAHSGRPLKTAVAMHLGDLRRQAEQMISSAREEAAQIIGQARLEATQLIEQADKAGHAQGFERGLAEGKQASEVQGRDEALQQRASSLEQLTQSWTEALKRWDDDREIMFNDAREDVIRFAFGLARKVVHRLVQTDPTIVSDQLAHALSLLSQPTKLRIVVHPSDRDLVEETLPQLLTTIARSGHAGIHSDASITPGGCMVITAGGSIDATIDTQLDRIAEALVPRNRQEISRSEHIVQKIGPAAA